MRALVDHGIDLESDEYGETDVGAMEDRRTYARLVEDVHDAYTQREGAPSRELDTLPTFSALDDSWDALIRSLGLRERGLMERHDMPRSIPQTDATQTVVLAGGASITGSTRHLYPRAVKRASCARGTRVPKLISRRVELVEQGRSSQCNQSAARSGQRSAQGSS